MSSAPDTTDAPAPTGRPDEIKAVPVRHPGRWVAAAIVLVIAVALVHSVVTNKNFGWQRGRRTTCSTRGSCTASRLTIELTVACHGARRRARDRCWRSCGCRPTRSSPAAAGCTSGSSAARRCSCSCCSGTTSPRCTRRSTLGIPFGPQFVHLDANTLIKPFVAVLLGARPQRGRRTCRRSCAPASSPSTRARARRPRSLGMTRLQTMRRIVLPQAMRVIIPPTGNETISMLKTTSLAFVVAYPELLASAQHIYSQNYETIQLLIVASLLVPRDDQRALRRPVLPRAPLRARRHARAAADAAAAHPPRAAVDPPRPGGVRFRPRIRAQPDRPRCGGERRRGGGR